MGSCMYVCILVVATVITWKATIKVAIDTLGDTCGLEGASQEQFEAIGFPVLRIVLADISDHLNSVLTPPKKAFGGGGAAACQTTYGYDADELVAMYVSQGVFKAMHGLLGRLEIAIIDNMSDESEVLSAILNRNILYIQSAYILLLPRRMPERVPPTAQQMTLATMIAGDALSCSVLVLRLFVRVILSPQIKVAV
jgi:hypothetical protein